MSEEKHQEEFSAHKRTDTPPVVGGDVVHGEKITGDSYAVGASGSGKSSLLRAGVVPRLRQKNWSIHFVGDEVSVLARDKTCTWYNVIAEDDVNGWVAASGTEPFRIIAGDMHPDHDTLE